MRETAVVRAQIAGLRRFYWVAVVLVTSVGVFTFVGLAVTIWEHDWLRVRVAVLTYVAASVFQLIASARFTDTLDWGAAGAWLYVLFLCSVLVLGLLGIRRTRLAPREPVPEGPVPVPR